MERVDLLNHPIVLYDTVAVCFGETKHSNHIKIGKVIKITKAQVRVAELGTNRAFNYKNDKVIVINEQYKHNLSEYAEKFI
jgi:hypothetical protein